MSTKIFITCPETNFSVWTGFRAPPGTGLDALKEVVLHKCPGCGNAHSWNSGSAYWEDDEVPPQHTSFWGMFKSKRRRAHHPHA